MPHRSRPASRIAFVYGVDSAHARRVAMGISRFATPARGMLTREFGVGPDEQLPAAFLQWQPDAIVCFVAADRRELLTVLEENGRPVVNTSRDVPTARRGVVLGDAEEVYDAVHAHFREQGYAEVHQYILGEDVPGGARDRYRRYAERKGLAWHSFATEHDPPFIHDLRRMDRVDPELARWLSSLRRPAGIFSQNSLAGPYLCRVCAALEIDVPGEIGVVGADSTDVALACQPPLSSIRVPAETIGYMAAKLVVDMLEGRSPPTEPVIVPGSKLIGRASTGALPQAGCDVDMALTFITNHACEGVTVNDLVMQTQEVSRMTFHKRFCEATGMTPGKALQERRLSEARRLLAETVFSISAVAGMCGYANDLYFSQVFRRSEGVAPRTYRRLHQRR